MKLNLSIFFISAYLKFKKKVSLVLNSYKKFVDKWWIVIIIAILSLALIGSNLVWLIVYNNLNKKFSDSYNSYISVRNASAECLKTGGIEVVVPDGKDLSLACMHITFQYGTTDQTDR